MDPSEHKGLSLNKKLGLKCVGFVLLFLCCENSNPREWGWKASQAANFMICGQMRRGPILQRIHTATGNVSNLWPNRISPVPNKTQGHIGTFYLLWHMQTKTWSMVMWVAMTAQMFWDGNRGLCSPVHAVKTFANKMLQRFRLLHVFSGLLTGCRDEPYSGDGGSRTIASCC